MLGMLWYNPPCFYVCSTFARPASLILLLSFWLSCCHPLRHVHVHLPGEAHVFAKLQKHSGKQTVWCFLHEHQRFHLWCCVKCQLMKALLQTGSHLIQTRSHLMLCQSVSTRVNFQLTQQQHEPEGRTCMPTVLLPIHVFASQQPSCRLAVL